MTEVFLALAVGIAVGIWVTDRFHRRIMRDFLEAMQFTDQDLHRLKLRLAKMHLGHAEEPELDHVEVTLEQHQGQIYAFRKADDTFLGQGTDRDSLIARLNETMKPCRITVSDRDGSELLQKNNS